MSARLERRLELLRAGLFLFALVTAIAPPNALRPLIDVRGVDLTPGPIVEDTVTDFRYLPFAADGFALTTLSTSAWAFSMRLCGGERGLAERRVDDAGLVDAELHLARLDLRIACAMSA